MASAEGGPQGAGGSVDTAAKLFDLHFNRIYDFCLRLLGTPEAAAEAAEEAFRSALAAPATVALSAASFDVRLFSAALDAAEPRLKVRHPSSIGSNPLFYQIDVERLGDATRAPSAQETSSLIWETVSRLDPADCVLLDLHFRQGFGEPDLAAILHTTQGAVKSRLTKLTKKIEPELAALIIGRRGSRNCDGMRRAMLGLPIAASRAQVKKAVEKHARSCPLCTATAVGLTSPLLVLGAMSLVVPSSADTEAAKERLMASAASLPAVSMPVATAAAQRPPVVMPPVATGAAMGSGGIVGGGGPGIMAGFADLWHSLGNINFSGSKALPIMGGVVVLAVAIGIALGSGVFGGSGGGSKSTPTPTATRTVTSTPSPKPTATETAEPTATEEPATATPESEATVAPPTATAGPTQKPTATEKPPTSTPAETDTPEPTHTPRPTKTPTP